MNNPRDFSYRSPSNELDALKQSIAEKLLFNVGKNPAAARPGDWLRATAFAVRDRLVERWIKTTEGHYARDDKRVYYLSMEFLMGRAMDNALLALELRDTVREALRQLGCDYDVLTDLEPDAALGNGGLGRLAACFLDSMATLGIAGYGYGIRYDYGMFRQTIQEGQQVEAPDYWLTHGNPWEFARPEVTYRVRFGGHVTQNGEFLQWVDTHDVLAMAYDTIVPGYGTQSTNTLRLWSARATEEINLGEFNRGNYFAAVESKNHSENVSRVLYPDDSTPSGRELRLHQEYFFVSASVQDLLRRYRKAHQSFEALPEKVSIHLNDTHPVLAIPELMRLLIDEHGLEWEQAWRLCQGVFSYTNHTLMHEALETWPVDMMGRVLPRHLQIILEINAYFLKALSERRGASSDQLRAVSLIDEHGERRVRMAYLAVVASHSINGVSALHTDLMKQSIFYEFAKLWPERFNNKTNGITPRRWLSQANPPLSGLLDEAIGSGWRRDLSRLEALRSMVHQPGLQDGFFEAKQANKRRLVEWIARHQGVHVDPNALFDIQIKRIHEYKRQLLNVLHVIARYFRILDNPGSITTPRVVLIAGKAASAYHVAKLIIRLINDVAQVINHDPRVEGMLQLLFIPNYRVTLAEVLIPGADLSEQISTAGTEASGTGNMKFGLNGALTIGTLDGANVEMREHVGEDNIFIFGHTTAEVQTLRQSGYQPRSFIEANPELKRVVRSLRDGRFSPSEPGRYQTLYDILVNWGDHYLLMADFESYVRTQFEVDACYEDRARWLEKCVRNVAGMGFFSSDRTIAEYAREIWRV